MEFMYGVPSQLIFREGAASDIVEIVEDLGLKKILCICSEEAKNIGIVDEIIETLDDELIKVFEFKRTAPNATYELTYEALELAKEKRVQGIIAIGSGGAINLAKAVNVLYSNPGKLGDFEGFGRVKINTTPLIAIPMGAGITYSITSFFTAYNAEIFKGVTVGGKNVSTSISLIDASVATKLPAESIALTGMNALSYAVEAYYSKNSTVVTEMNAKKAIELISMSLKDSVNNKKGKDSIEKLMLGSVFSGLACDSSFTGLIHSISNPLSAYNDVSQTMMNAVMLPHVVMYNGNSDLDKTKKIGKIMGFDISKVADENVSKEVGKGILAFSKAVNIPTLKDLGITNEEFELIAEDAMHESSTYFNPDIPSKERIIEILNSAIE